MLEEDITRQHLAILYEDQEAHVLALRALFSIADSTLERQEVLNQSLALLMALQ